MPQSAHRFALATIFSAIAAIAPASDLGDRLDRDLKGAWGVLEVEVYSGCAGTYNDNTVGASGVAGKAEHRFEPGELIKIDKLKVKRSRVDLLVTIAAPILVSRMDGPFELFDQAGCRAQLIFELPREQVKGGDATAILSRIKEAVTPYPSLDAARSSDDWNGRELEALPADYEETLQRHAVWKTEQTNAAVDEGIARALTAAAHVAEDLDDDADYLAGFAAGAEKMSKFSVQACSSLLNASFSTYRSRAPKDRPNHWRGGYDDGQKLIFNVLLADRLTACRVAVPPLDRQ